MVTTLEKVQGAVAQFGFTASSTSPEADVVNVRNRKNEICATVQNKEVVQKYAGAKNLCGALVRNAIKNALSAS